MSATEVAILQKIITNLAGQTVSDLYLRAGSQPVIRRDGELVTLDDEAVVTSAFLDASLSWLLTVEQRQVVDSNKQLTIGYTFANRLRLRVTVFYQQGLPEITIRFISNPVKSLTDLGWPPVLEKLAASAKGLIILSGSYGSGRSLSLASLLSHINNTQARHIVTVEEPIEFLLLSGRSVVDQREIGKDANTWEEAIDNLPKEDCDVVALSHLVNTKVVSQAIDLALGGKLVVVVVESDSAIKTVERLVGTFKPDDQDNVRWRLADALLAVCFQRLLPRVGGGRVLVPEILLGTAAAKTIIQEGKYYQLINLLQTARAEGMMSFDYALAELVKTGEVMRDIALPQAHDQELFNSLLRRS
ncbi:MAG: Flp pilus assembly complex ATPase component TadA [Candidatus Kerfeldbacteria bacterium]|nr:Flp pilus assembly complex ATPase component TadA [Candidatus Kerfeldbacteria bacterium]